MKVLLIVLLLLFILVILFILCFKSREKEYLDNNTTLKNPNHMPSDLYRVTNTILTAANIFNDKIDQLTLPKEVEDEFNEWIEKGFVSPVKDQMLCGGCWAFATCGSLADRIAIVTNGKLYLPYGLSEQILISCGGVMGMKFYNGCSGGIPHFAIDALTKEGVPADIKCLNCQGTGSNTTRDNTGAAGVVNPNNSNTCKSGGNVYANTDYTWWQTGCDSNTGCSLAASSTCPCDTVKDLISSQKSDGLTKYTIKYKTIGEAHNYTSHGENNELHTVDLWPDIPPNIMKKNVDRMKKAIYYEGPITIGYRVTADFYRFKPSADNYYKYCNAESGGSTGCNMTGGHAVVIVGWKKIGNVPVWIVKNSWGENWGYGFPDGPKWIDPTTGKETLKYPGGFWNHIMGENDSFIESNATGAYPNIKIEPVSNFIPKNIPDNWYENMTLREIWNKTKAVVSQTSPTLSPQTSPTLSPQTSPTFSPQTSPTFSPQTSPTLSQQTSPTLSTQTSPTVLQTSPTLSTQTSPTMSPQTSPTLSTQKLTIITNQQSKENNYKITNLTPINITPQSIQEFFNNKDSLYIIGTNHHNLLANIINALPDDKKGISEMEMKNFINILNQQINGYIVIAARGTSGNYWYLYGDPSDWNNRIVNEFVKPVATLKNLIYNIYSKFQGLIPLAPMVMISNNVY